MRVNRPRSAQSVGDAYVGANKTTAIREETETALAVNADVDSEIINAGIIKLVQDTEVQQDYRTMLLRQYVAAADFSRDSKTVDSINSYAESDDTTVVLGSPGTATFTDDALALPSTITRREGGVFSRCVTFLAKGGSKDASCKVLVTGDSSVVASCSTTVATASFTPLTASSVAEIAVGQLTMVSYRWAVDAVDPLWQDVDTVKVMSGSENLLLALRYKYTGVGLGTTDAVLQYRYTITGTWLTVDSGSTDIRYANPVLFAGASHNSVRPTNAFLTYPGGSSVVAGRYRYTSGSTGVALTSGQETEIVYSLTTPGLGLTVGNIEFRLYSANTDLVFANSTVATGWISYTP